MSRAAPYGRSSSQSRDRARFEDAFRVYHEVEDVGKTVKASKRRARWTFSFGAQGPEHEVILLHSVMSGKKNVTYDGRTIYHAEEMSRAFSHSWHDGDHVLRVDISDLVDYGTGRGGDRMYELTLDGVPFGSLPIKPVTLPPRPGFARGGSRASLSESQQQQRRRESGGGGIGGSASLLGDDDFDPRGSSSSAAGNGKPKAIMRQPSGATGANTVDLLGDAGFVAAAPAAPATSGGFDPFGSGAGANATASSFPTTFGGPAPVAAAPDTKQLAAEFGSLSFTAPPAAASAFPTAPLLPQKATGGGNGKGPVPLPDMSTFKQPENAGMPTPGDEAGGAGAGGMSTAIIAVGDAQTPDVARLTAALVNLNNLERESDGTKSPQRNIYRSVYADNRSLEDLKTSQANKPQAQPAKPIFIERPVPPVPSPRGPPMMMMQQHPQAPYGMGMGIGMPPQPAFYGQHPSPRGPPMMGMGMQQQPPMMMGGGMGMGMQQPPQYQQPMVQQQGRPPMMMGGGAPPMGGGGMGMGMIPPPPQQQQQQQGGMMMGGGGPRPGMGMGMMGGPQPQMQMQMQQGAMPPRGPPPGNDPFFGL